MIGFLTLVLLAGTRVRTSGSDAEFPNPLAGEGEFCNNEKVSQWVTLQPGTQVALVASSSMGDVYCAVVQEPTLTGGGEDPAESKAYGVVFRKESWKKLIANSSESRQTSWAPVEIERPAKPEPVAAAPEAEKAPEEAKVKGKRGRKSKAEKEAAEAAALAAKATAEEGLQAAQEQPAAEAQAEETAEAVAAK